MLQLLKEKMEMSLKAIKKVVSPSEEPGVIIGADPEFFLFDKKSEKMVSAHGLVPGTKEEPYKVPDGAIQLDGTAVEFNIDPAKTPEEFQKNVQSVLKTLRKHIPKRYNFTFTPSVVYDRAYFDKLIPEKPKELGCSPDYCAYSKRAKTPPKLGGDMRYLRTGSGHLHIGWTNNADPSSEAHLNDCFTFVRVLEFFIGPFAYFYDFDHERSSLYGAPGSFRPKPYGLEWRSPSNEWLNHPALMRWYYEAIQSVFKALKNWDNKEFTYLTANVSNQTPYRNNTRGYSFGQWIGVTQLGHFGFIGYQDLFGYVNSSLQAPTPLTDEEILDLSNKVNKKMKKYIKDFPDFPMKEILPKVRERYVEVTGNPI